MRRIAMFGALAVMLVGAGTAQAAIQLSGARAQPLDTKLQNAKTAFNIHLDLGGTERIKSFRTELGAGLGTNVTHPICSADAFKQDACPADTQVGVTRVAVTIASVLNETIQGRIYFVDADPPAGFDTPGLGIVLDSPPPAPKAFQRGKTEIDEQRGGTNNTVDNFPTSSGGFPDLPVRINSLDISLTAEFIRNPPRCTPTTTTFIVTSYEDPNNPSRATDTYTPEGCKPPPPERCKGKAATIEGTAKRDVLRGTNKRDVIVGFGGNDVIRGRGGNDIICGNKGKDKLIGGPGKDKLYGGAGKDVLRGGPGRNLVKQ